MNNYTSLKKNKKKFYLVTVFCLNIFLFMLTISADRGFAQDMKTETTNNLPNCNSVEQDKVSLSPGGTETENRATEETELSKENNTFLQADEGMKNARIAAVESELKRLIREKTEEKTKQTFTDKDSAQTKERFHWRAALIESGIFLGIQHGFRMMQPKTTSELGGPFFRDWAKSVKNLHGWNDGDSPFTNNFAHSLQGGATGRIFINNSDRAKKLEFGKSKKYWESRMKALAWSAVWSTQFEFGPISEASLGNVGLREKNGHSTMAWTDLIMTPVVGTGVVIGEDAIDKYILKNWLERKSANRATNKIKFLRSILTPTTSFSNLLRGKAPWKRNDR